MILEQITEQLAFTPFVFEAVGDLIDAPHMARARAAILARGGARRCNVFTRILLALWGEVPWRAVPWPAGRWRGPHS